MTFENAVANTPGLENAFRSGLQALSRADRRRVRAKDAGRLRGSVNVDAAFARSRPNDPRWDYAVGHHPVNRNQVVVYWIEVHPANSGEINAVLAKLTWLKEWLRQSAPDLQAMRKAFIWISSGKTSFTPNSPQRKQLALLGLQHQGRVFSIPDD